MPTKVFDGDDLSGLRTDPENHVVYVVAFVASFRPGDLGEERLQGIVPSDRDREALIASGDFVTAHGGVSSFLVEGQLVSIAAFSHQSAWASAASASRSNLDLASSVSCLRMESARRLRASRRHTALLARQDCRTC